MKTASRNRSAALVALGASIAFLSAGLVGAEHAAKTSLAIKGEQFFVNGKPTYEGRVWRGHKIEGLLLNARMVQGIFDDLNPDTVHRWVYPDTSKWDPDRNT